MEFFTEFPEMGRQDLRDFKKGVDASFREFSRNYGDALESFFEPLLWFLVWLEKLLTNAPWPIVIAVVAALAWLGSRSWKLVTGTVAAFLVIGYFGMWEDTMATLAIISVATLLCISLGIPIGIFFFLDSTLSSSALMLAGRHDVQGMAAIGLIFEWSALAIMVPVGLSEAIVQWVASAIRNDGPQRTTITVITRAALMVCSAYVVLLAFIHFGLGINVPVYFIIDAAAHPDLVARLDDLALLGFLVAAFHAVIIVLEAILRGLLDVKTSMVATLVCYWGIGLGLTVLFGEILRLDVWYVLLAVVIALATSTAVIALRLRIRLRMPRDAD